MMNLAKLKGLSEWPKVRGEIESAVLSVLGEMPKERAELQTKVIDEDSFPGYVRRRVSYFVDDWSRVSAWLFVPDGKEEVPGILCCHQTVPQGKDEPAGIEGDANLAFARRYAEMGYVTIAPDCIGAGERVGVGLDPFDTRHFYKDYRKWSAMGKMLWDHVHAMDALCETKRVDPGRIGVIGHSLGGHNALMLAAFDERVQGCVASCGFTRFADDKTPGRWARDEGFVYMPALVEAVKAKKYPFDWEHVLALAAPAPILLITALNDACFSNTKSCEKAAKTARRVYEMLGEPEAIENHEHREGHGMTTELLEVADAWFERWL